MQSMDTDNSGTITADELREAMKKQGSPLVQEELQRLLESIDVDATGRQEPTAHPDLLLSSLLSSQRASADLSLDYILTLLWNSSSMLHGD